MQNEKRCCLASSNHFIISVFITPKVSASLRLSSYIIWTQLHDSYFKCSWSSLTPYMLRLHSSLRRLHSPLMVELILIHSLVCISVQTYNCLPFQTRSSLMFHAPRT